MKKKDSPEKRLVILEEKFNRLLEILINLNTEHGADELCLEDQESLSELFSKR